MFFIVLVFRLVCSRLAREGRAVFQMVKLAIGISRTFASSKRKFFHS